MKGYIKLHRKLLTSELYLSLDSYQRDVLIQCLLLASYKESEWEYRGDVYQCKPGQFITSLRKLQLLCAKDSSLQRIRTSLLKLKSHGFLTYQSTKHGRLITILNWDRYQGEDEPANKASNKQSTNNQQTTNNYQEDKKIRKQEKSLSVSSDDDTTEDGDDKEERGTDRQFPELERLLAKVSPSDAERYKENKEYYPAIRMAIYLYRKMKERYPKRKSVVNARTDTWVHDCKLILVNDERDINETKMVVDYAMDEDPFWRNVIKGPKSVRKHYDTILGKIKMAEEIKKKEEESKVRFSPGRMLSDDDYK